MQSFPVPCSLSKGCAKFDTSRKTSLLPEDLAMVAEQETIVACFGKSHNVIRINHIDVVVLKFIVVGLSGKDSSEVQEFDGVPSLLMLVATCTHM